MKRILSALVSLAVVTTIGIPAGARGRYLAPVAAGDGKVFPVARTDWYSVINFTHDWHAPRMRFIDGRWVQVGIHEGNDIFAEPGTPILSITGGRVEQLGWTFYSGWRVGVRGDDGKYWFYAHMRRFEPGLNIGERVEPGTRLGEVGNTGYGETPGHSNEFIYHLHLGIQEPDGSWSDPYPLLRRLYRTAVRGS